MLAVGREDCLNDGAHRPDRKGDAPDRDGKFERENLHLVSSVMVRSVASPDLKPDPARALREQLGKAIRPFDHRDAAFLEVIVEPDPLPLPPVARAGKNRNEKPAAARRDIRAGA